MVTICMALILAALFFAYSFVLIRSETHALRKTQQEIHLIRRIAINRITYERRL